MMADLPEQRGRLRFLWASLFGQIYHNISQSVSNVFTNQSNSNTILLRW